MENRIILEMRNVFKRREQGGVAFELVVPEIRLVSGQFVAVVGDSGCGKSTLLDIMALVSRPSRSTRFRCLFAGNGGSAQELDIGGLWEKNDEMGLATIRMHRLGYVLQTGGLLPFLTVRQNIELPLRIKGEADVSHPGVLAKKIGIGGLLGKKPQFLSGGQRQRVAIIRALAHKPQLILADEPTAAVDKKRAESIVRDFHSLARESGATIVMVTHDRNLVKDLSDATYTFDVDEISETLTRSTAVEIR